MEIRIPYGNQNCPQLTEPAIAGSGNRWPERLISYDPDGNILSLDRYQDDGTTPSDRLRFTCTGARRDGWGGGVYQLKKAARQPPFPLM